MTEPEHEFALSDHTQAAETSPLNNAFATVNTDSKISTMLPKYSNREERKLRAEFGIGEFSYKKKMDPLLTTYYGYPYRSPDGVDQYVVDVTKQQLWDLEQNVQEIARLPEEVSTFRDKLALITLLVG